MNDRPAHRSRHGGDVDWWAMVTSIELEAEVLSPLLADSVSLLAEVCDRMQADVRQILDLGSGPGVGTCALAERFPAATVVAVDGSTEMLAQVVARADRLGLTSRVQVQRADLPAGLADLGRVDLVWASMVLHHLGDETATLGAVRSLLEPEGLLAMVEFGDAPRFVPDTVDLDAAWRAAIPAAAIPAVLERSGFELLADRMLTAALGPPLDDRARQVARRHLERVRETAEPDDLRAAEALLRTDETVFEVSRRLLIARPVQSA